MPTQTYNKWPDPVIMSEGIDQNEPPRKRKRRYSIRPGSIFWYGKGIVEGAVLLFAIFCWIYLFSIFL